jgi:diacylglycerol kinase family enzyme
VGVPASPAEALRRALIADPRPTDVGWIRDDLGRQEYFDNTLGIGFDGVVNLRSHRLPLLRGFLMYFVAVVQTILLNFDPMKLHIETDTETLDAHVLMLTLCNGPREGGGFHVAPAARLDDGLLDYVLVSRLSRLMMFRLIPEFMNGTQARFPQVRLGTFRRLTLVSDRPLYIHADGEVFSGFGTRLHRLEVEVLPGALRVAC